MELANCDLTDEPAPGGERSDGAVRLLRRLRDCGVAVNGVCRAAVGVDKAEEAIDVEELDRPSGVGDVMVGSAMIDALSVSGPERTHRSESCIYLI